MSHPVMARRTVKVWDPGVRIFHWLLVISIAVAFLSSEEESALAPWHIPAGWVAAVLIAFRLIWGLVGGEHARFANFIRPSKIAAHLTQLFNGRLEPSLGHNPVGALAVMALIGLVAMTVATGIAGGEDGHEVIAYALLGLAAIHVIAVVAMSALTRDNLVLAMITGRKHADRHPDASDAKSPSLGAGILALLVTGGAVFAAIQNDPQAFMPHAGEGGESEGAGREQVHDRADEGDD